MHTILILIVGLAIALLAGILWRRMRAAQLLARQKLAKLQLQEQFDELTSAFLAAAQASGKPRGLAWKDCELSGVPVFTVDRVSGELYALLTATISFEAVEGGGMEDVEAVGNLRTATVIFVYRNQHWATDGRAVFNLEPDQVLDRFSESLQPVE